ncbi:MAG TPA: hypothetical protein VG845_11575 [Dehalococcoidia bacterium]|nr:hypothetical protein [Dehalococcoidia bacterium]
MANPKTATTTRAGQRYYDWRGERFYSVTTMINGGMPKPALINWAKKFTAEYAYDHQDVLAAMVADGDRDGAIDWLKNAAYRDRDKKADLGTYLHEAIEAYALGKPFPKIRDEASARMTNFHGFLEEYRPVFEMTEASVFNRTHRYAGTLDAIIRLGDPGNGEGARLLLDMKSGKAVYPEVALQLAAYTHAEFVAMPDGSEKPMPPVDGACALHLSDDGFELVDVQADEEVFRFFLHVREVYRWKTDVENHVLRGPLRLDGPVQQMSLEAS